MLNIYLCEDNDKQRSMLNTIIDNIVLMEDYDLHFAYSTADPHDFLAQVTPLTGTGLYFLDIDLNSDINGLTLAQQLRKIDPRGFIVFITTHSEMSYMTFTYKVEAMDFIIKDNPHELQNRIHQCIIDAYAKYTSRNNVAQRTFKIKVSDKEYCFALNDILFFETSETIHKLILHTNSQIFEFTGKLKDIEPLLDSRFYRCHRSYLVNRAYIKEIFIKERYLTLSNSETCLISAKSLKGLSK